MGIYLYGCISTGICAAVALGLVHKEYRSASKGALGVIVIAVVLSFALELGDIGSISVPDLDFDSTVSGEQYEQALRASFEEGIERAICDRFTLLGGVRVVCEDFDYQKMRAGTLRVYLSGAAALSDNRSVREYVRGNFLCEGGRCIVELEEGEG